MYNKFYSSSSLFFKKKNIIYNIRDSLIFEIELCRTNFLLFSLVFNGPKTWNDINIKKSKSKSIFAKKIHDKFIDNYNYSNNSNIYIYKKNIVSFLLCYNFQPDIYIQIVFITLLVI